MRIRGTKPEFWKSKRIAKFDTVTAFDGPLPAGYRKYSSLPQMRWDSEYVYLLLSNIGRPIYIGRSFRPADRFASHCRNPWWKDVAHLTIVRVTGASREEAMMQTAIVEKVLIEELKPSGNIASGQTRWVHDGAY